MRTISLLDSNDITEFIDLKAYGFLLKQVFYYVWHDEGSTIANLAIMLKKFLEGSLDIEFNSSGLQNSDLFNDLYVLFISEYLISHDAMDAARSVYYQYYPENQIIHSTYTEHISFQKLVVNY